MFGEVSAFCGTMQSPVVSIVDGALFTRAVLNFSSAITSEQRIIQTV